MQTTKSMFENHFSERLRETEDRQTTSRMVSAMLSLSADKPVCVFSTTLLRSPSLIEATIPLNHDIYFTNQGSSSFLCQFEWCVLKMNHCLHFHKTTDFSINRPPRLGVCCLLLWFVCVCCEVVARQVSFKIPAAFQYSCREFQIIAFKTRDQLRSSGGILSFYQFSPVMSQQLRT